MFKTWQFLHIRLGQSPNQIPPIFLNAPVWSQIAKFNARQCFHVYCTSYVQDTFLIMPHPYIYQVRSTTVLLDETSTIVLEDIQKVIVATVAIKLTWYQEHKVSRLFIIFEFENELPIFQTVLPFKWIFKQFL